MLTGTCADCHRVTTLVEGTLPLGSSGGSTPSSPPASGSPAAGPECADCGGPLTVRAREDGTLEVACEECDTTTTFVAQEGGRPPPAPRREERWSRGSRSPRDDAERTPRSRPCRQCGAPLTFTTAEDGTLTGECASCGNRFSLPPRRTGPAGTRDGFRQGFGGRGGRRDDRTRGGWSGRGRTSGRRYGDRPGNFRPRRRPSEDDTDDDDRRRRPARRD